MPDTTCLPWVILNCSNGDGNISEIRHLFCFQGKEQGGQPQEKRVCVWSFPQPVWFPLHRREQTAHADVHAQASKPLVSCFMHGSPLLFIFLNTKEIYQLTWSWRPLQGLEHSGYSLEKFIQLTKRKKKSISKNSSRNTSIFSPAKYNSDKYFGISSLFFLNGISLRVGM